MGTRYIVTVTCPNCGRVHDDVYYAPTCECGTKIDLAEHAEISYEDASNLEWIEHVVASIEPQPWDTSADSLDLRCDCGIERLSFDYNAELEFTFVSLTGHHYSLWKRLKFAWSILTKSPWCWREVMLDKRAMLTLKGWVDRVIGRYCT